MPHDWRTAAVITLLAAPASAELSCVFDRECLSGEACTETQFAATLQSSDAGVEMLTDAETLMFETGAALPLAAVRGDTSRADRISVTASGEALYLLDMADDGFHALYLGACSGAF